MSLFSGFLDLLGTPDDGAESKQHLADVEQGVADGSALYAGGDPVAGSIAVGHDFAETNRAQEDIAAAQAAKGSTPLTAAEEAAVLARHPSADGSLARQPVRVAEIKQTVTGIFNFLGSLGKWVVFGIVALFALAFFLRFKR